MAIRVAIGSRRDFAEVCVPIPDDSNIRVYTWSAQALCVYCPQIKSPKVSSICPSLSLSLSRAHTHSPFSAILRREFTSLSVYLFIDVWMDEVGAVKGGPRRRVEAPRRASNAISRLCLFTYTLHVARHENNFPKKIIKKKRERRRRRRRRKKKIDAVATRAHISGGSSHFPPSLVCVKVVSYRTTLLDETGSS